MMKLIGVDVYVWSESIPDLPKTIGPLTLHLMSNRGTRVYPPPAPEIDFIDWFRCRYLAPSEVSHQDIDKLLSTLSTNFTWTKAQKLFEQNGSKAFSEPY